MLKNFQLNKRFPDVYHLVFSNPTQTLINMIVLYPCSKRGELHLPRVNYISR